MAHQAGFENVVASLGHRAHAAAGGADHPLREADRARLRRRRGGREGRHLRGDGARGADPPAGRATTRAWSWTTSASCSLPEGRDPDEVMRDEPDRWREEVRTARPIVDHLIDVHARAHDLRTPGGQARFVDAVLPIIRNLAEPGAARRLPRAASSQVSRGGGADAARGDAPPPRPRARRPRRPRPLHRRGRDPRRRTRCRSPRSCAASRAPSRSCCAWCCSCPRRTTPCSTAWARTGCRRQVARELYRAVVVARARDDHGVRPPFVAVGDPRRARRGEPRPRPGARLAARAQPARPRRPRRSPTRSSA